MLAKHICPVKCENKHDQIRIPTVEALELKESAH